MTIAVMRDGTPVPSVVLERGWHRDESAFDPSTTIRWVTVDGRRVQLTNKLGPGFPMNARIADAANYTSATLLWEDWPALVAYVARTPKA